MGIFEGDTLKQSFATCQTSHIRKVSNLALYTTEFSFIINVWKAVQHATLVVTLCLGNDVTRTSLRTEKWCDLITYFKCTDICHSFITTTFKAQVYEREIKVFVEKLIVLQILQYFCTMRSSDSRCHLLEKSRKSRDHGIQNMVHLTPMPLKFQGLSKMKETFLL